MDASTPDIKDLEDQLDAAERNARALVADLAEERGGWRTETGSWSVVECLDHLASANRVYLHAMKEPAIRAREQSRFRRGPATPGFVGRWYVKTMEPPVKAPFRMKVPRIVEPRAAPPLVNAFASSGLRVPPRVRRPGSSRGPIPEPLYPASASAWPLACTSSPLTRDATCGRLGGCVGQRRARCGQGKCRNSA
jgi:hypothetical protein